MNIYTYTLIGFFLILLKPSMVYADSFHFPDSSCYELAGKTWKNVSDCKKSEKTYSLSQSNQLFCAYKLNSGETAQDAAKKMKFYRNLKESNLINYNSGKIKSNLSSAPSTILFSKRDLLVKTSNFCKPITNESDLSKVFYLLHFPNSFYVLKSGLKTVQHKRTAVNQTLFTKVKPEDDKLDTFDFARSFTIKPRLFYENLKGTQVTNSTEASISGKLSPGLNLKFALGEHKDWQYGASVDLDFHIFDERAGEFLLNNNTVQTLALNLFTRLKMHQRFSAELILSLYEDIYYARTSSSSLAIEKELVPRATLGTDLKIYNRNGFAVKISPTVFYDISAGPLQSGFGYTTPLAFEITRKEQIWTFGASYLSLSKELTDLELERSSLSFYVETKVFF